MSAPVAFRTSIARPSSTAFASRHLNRKVHVAPSVQRALVVKPQAFFGGNKAASSASSQYYICVDCGYIYDMGPWAECPSYFRCPACNSPKSRFKVYKGDDVKGKPNNSKATLQKRMKEKKW